MDYFDKLKDVRWKNKRQEILERDNFTCQKCNSKRYYNTTDEVPEKIYDLFLNVHHFDYNGDPWESNNEDLVTLCESCHAYYHSIKNEELKKLEMIKIKRTMKLLSGANNE